MGWKDVTVGEKIAKVVGARFIKSGNGKTGLEVAFEFEETATNTRERLNWVGWLTAEAIKNTMETLVNVLGFNGSEETDENGILTDKKAFDLEREVKLIIDMETNPNNGKEYPRIKWVNSMSGSGFAGVEKASLKNELAAIGFKAAFLASKQKNGGPATTKTPTPKADDQMGPPLDPNDIPF